MTKKKVCKKGCVDCDECLVKQKMKKMKLAKAKASLKLKNPIVKQQVPNFDWMRALPPQQKQRVDKTLTLDELRHEIQQALNPSRFSKSEQNHTGFGGVPLIPLFGGALSQLRERIKDNVREQQQPSAPLVAQGAERRKPSVPIINQEAPLVDVPVAPFFGFQPERQKGSIREVTPEFGFQPPSVAERRKTSEPEFGFGEQLRETISEFQPQKGSIREVAPFIEEPSEFFDIERESQPLLIRQQDYDVDDDNQPLQYIPPYAEGDEQDEPEEEKQSLFSRAKKSLFGFLNSVVEPEEKIPRSFRQEKEEMKEELAEEDVGETKDDLPPAFERLPPPQFEVDEEEEFEDAEGGEQDAGFGDAPSPDDEPLPQVEVPLLEVEQHELELPSTSTFQPIDDEPLPPPFVPSLQAQPDYEDENDNDPLPYIKEEEEDFNFGITPEELASSSSLLTGYKKAEEGQSKLKEIDEDEFYRQAQSALGGDMIFIKPEPLLFGGAEEEEKPKVTKSKVTIKDELQRGAREKAAAEAASGAAEEPSGKAKRGRPVGSKNSTTIAKERNAAKGQSSMFSVFPTQVNTNPLEIVETSSGLADVEGVRQEKGKESPFIPEASATFMPEARLTRSQSSLEKE